tara:strand:+ start:2500 stop:2736 length:237 start_codon:yes stop_codon:yes gene_type:complete
VIDSIRLFPMIQPSGYPDKSDVVDRKMEKQQEIQRTMLEQKKTQIAIEDLAFEIYTKNAEQEKLRLEIFQNRKLDIYV